MPQSVDSPTTGGVPATLLESPSFQLERLRRRTRDEVEAALGARGTTMRGYWALTCLVERDASSQASLSATLGLEAQGWARRERDPKDRRRQIVTSTKKGTKAQAELAQLVTDAEAAALDESTGKQLKHLRKLTKAVLVSDLEPDETKGD